MLAKEKFKAQPNQCLLCAGAKKTWLASGIDYEYASTDMKFDFYQCNNCSLIFIDPLPDESMWGVIYPNNYYAYQTYAYSKFIKFMRARQLDDKVRKFLKKSGRADNLNGLRVLEIGCGTGDLLKAFRRCNSNISLTGIDLSEEAIKLVITSGFKGQAGDICEMDLGEQKFDLIICQQLVEHLRNPLTLLSRIKSWLDTRGVLILETPGIESIDRIIFKGCWGGYHIPRHLFLFSEKTIKMTLDKYGFEVIDIFYDFCIAFWLWSLHNLIVKYIKKMEIARFFSLNNPLAILPFWIIEHLRIPFMKTASMGVVCKVS